MAARKGTTQQPRRRDGLNRAQLKALAARQAMHSTAVTAARPRDVEEPVAEAPLAPPVEYAGALPRAQRRATLSREQEFSFIRRDLIRLTLISLFLLALLLALLIILR